MSTKPIEIAQINADLIIHCVDPEQSPTPAAGSTPPNSIFNLTNTAPSPSPNTHTTTNSNGTTEHHKSFLVSSTILSTASTVFNAMLNSGFSESFTTPNTLRTITFQDQPRALHTIFLALHHRNLKIPRKLKIDELYNIATVLDKYDLYESLMPWVDLWCRGLQHRIGVDGKNEDFLEPVARMPVMLFGGAHDMRGRKIKYSDSRWLFISWVCKRGAIFRLETEYYMPRLRVMAKEEAEMAGEREREEWVLTVARRGTGVGSSSDKDRWVVNPIAGLSEKVLLELWGVRQSILEPVFASLKLYQTLLQTAAAHAEGGATACDQGDSNCDLIAAGLLQRILYAFGIKDITNDKETEDVVSRFSIFDVKKTIEQVRKGVLGVQQMWHPQCPWFQWVMELEELSGEVLGTFKGLEPWGKCRKGGW